MKRWLASILAGVMVLCMAACGGSQTSPAASSAESRATDSSAADQTNSENASSETNSSAEESSQAAESSEESAADPALRTLTPFELCAQYAVSQLSKVMKNPNSLIIHQLNGVEEEESYVFEIDYTGENSFGGAARDFFYLNVAPRENGFAVISTGSSSYAAEENQLYTKQIYDKKAAWSYYEFDPETFYLTSLVEVEHEYKEFVGELRGKNTSYEGAWNFAVDGDPYQKLVYFADGVDLSTFSENYDPKGENKMTLRAMEVNGALYDATIVSAEALKSVEERFSVFSYHDREFFKEYVKDLTPPDEETVKSLLVGQTFSMRNNFGGDGDGTHTISFRENGGLDANYEFNGKTNVMYKAWRTENGRIVLTTGSDSEKIFTVYQLDETRILMIDEEGDFSMALTVK